MNEKEILQILMATLGAFGFAILFNIRGYKLLASAIGGALGWTLYLLLHRVIHSDMIAYFIVAVIISLYAEVMAKLLKAPSTIFIAPSIIPLVPGASLYYTMTYALDRNLEMFSAKASTTVTIAVALAVGLVVSTVLVELFERIKMMRKRAKENTLNITK